MISTTYLLIFRISSFILVLKKCLKKTLNIQKQAHGYTLTKLCSCVCYSDTNKINN